MLHALWSQTIFLALEELENPCRGENPVNGFGPEKTFGCQSTFIVRHPQNPDLHIAMFDLWRPDQHNDGRYVWLLIEFQEDGTITISWQNEWSPPVKLKNAVAPHKLRYASSLA